MPGATSPFTAHNPNAHSTPEPPAVLGAPSPDLSLADLTTDSPPMATPPTMPIMDDEVQRAAAQVDEATQKLKAAEQAASAAAKEAGTAELNEKAWQAKLQSHRAEQAKMSKQAAAAEEEQAAAQADERRKEAAARAALRALRIAQQALGQSKLATQMATKSVSVANAALAQAGANERQCAERLAAAGRAAADREAKARAAAAAVLDAQSELADRSTVVAKLSEAKALGLSAGEMAKMSAQRALEREQLDAILQGAPGERRLAPALLRALLAQREESLQREQEAANGLAAVLTQQRAAMQLVEELQRRLSQQGAASTSDMLVDDAHFDDFPGAFE